MVVVKTVVLEQGVMVVVAAVGCLPKTAPVRLFFITDNGGDGFPFVLGRFERAQRGTATWPSTDHADAFGRRRGGHCFVKCGRRSC